MEQLATIAIFAIPIIIAITLHEAAHGFAARHFGDDTASKAGRVTLNGRHLQRFRSGSFLEKVRNLFR
jgi:Zn-dependent protease